MKTIPIEFTPEEVRFLLWMLGYVMAEKENEPYVQKNHDSIINKIPAHIPATDSETSGGPA